MLGGFRAQGRTAVKARAIVDDALALQAAGAFAVVVECVPAVVGRAIADSLKIPVIGIGAGGGCDGQVLVYHDVLGIMHHPHYEKHVPSFCKRYAKLGAEIHEALLTYKEEVESAAFPSEEFSPYKMSVEERIRFEEMMAADETQRSLEAEKIAKKLKEADEYAVTKLY